MPLATRINALATRIGQEVKTKAKVTASATAPTSPVEGEYWVDTSAVAGTVAASTFHVGPTEPVFTGQGMWVQTGLGPDGTDSTIWINDGT